ncbi:MAG: hypothetical protein UY61_C0025G0005 [Candidatus Adlerbacteria bacterium GW2011_GWC1_50_9]|uniref:Uncharacterized protein n=1 Tax=Candidatus Adlerbacteria bacterium GW2011_GWC1_50_9 TaxID=1618608 RepID=A0A0G1Z0A7_9BACT|nr:MAG: hypothetical protein UY61_C0025G0005 [Candidatus Adlerbacteria bacterium GW2011_GWC1_50_9]
MPPFSLGFRLLTGALIFSGVIVLFELWTVFFEWKFSTPYWPEYHREKYSLRVVTMIATTLLLTSSLASYIVAWYCHREKT